MLSTELRVTRTICAAILITLMIITAGKVEQAYAAYPEKPVTLIVPYKAGGSTDTLVRVFAKALSKEMSTPVVVKNQPGGAGAVAATFLKNQPADGYTILVGAEGITTWGPIHEKVEFTSEDFTYLGAISEYQQAIITSPDKPYKTLGELIAYSKKNPGLMFADQGSLYKMVFQYIAKKEGLKWRAVPTKGGGGMAPMLLSGRVDFAFSGGIHNRYGDKMKVLASVNPTRLAANPDIPSTAEKYKISCPSLVMVMGPKDIPADVVKTIETAMEKATKDGDYRKLLEDNLKFPVVYKTSAEMNNRIPMLKEQLQNTKKMIAE